MRGKYQIEIFDNLGKDQHKSSSENSPKEFFIEVDDATLWKAFRDGSDSAYSLIYKKYASQFYNYGRHIVDNPQLVEDCLHDLFVHIFQNRSTLGHTDSIKYYLYRALRRRIVEAVKADNKYADDDNFSDKNSFQVTKSPESELIESLSHQQQNTELTEAINSLPKRQREAVYLIYYSGLSYQEAAKIMSLEVRTVYNQIHNAVNLLKKLIKYTHFLIIVLLTLIFR